MFPMVDLLGSSIQTLSKYLMIICRRSINNIPMPQRTPSKTKSRVVDAFNRYLLSTGSLTLSLVAYFIRDGKLNEDEALAINLISFTISSLLFAFICGLIDNSHEHLGTSLKKHIKMKFLLNKNYFLWLNTEHRIHKLRTFVISKH